MSAPIGSDANVMEIEASLLKSLAMLCESCDTISESVLAGRYSSVVTVLTSVAQLVTMCTVQAAVLAREATKTCS